MIDKLEVRIPHHTPFHPEFNRIYTEVRGADTDPFRPTRNYELKGDLRPFGYDAVLHLQCRWGKEANHKLELFDTGEKTYAGLINEIERVFVADALKLGIMRLDLAADVEGIPVAWFHERVKAAHKQCIASFGSAQFVEMGRGGIQTLYFGKRPNLYRIYDKVAEYKDQFQKAFRGFGPDVPKPSFEEKFGIPDNGHVLTRVERQMGGGKIPENLATVADLKNAPDFRPFDALAIVTGGVPEPNPEEFSFEHYCAGMYLRDLAQRQGMHAAMRFISRYSKRNTRWALEKFAPFLPQESERQALNSDHLNDLYQNSITRQLAA